MACEGALLSNRVDECLTRRAGCPRVPAGAQVLHAASPGPRFRLGKNEAVLSGERAPSALMRAQLGLDLKRSCCSRSCFFNFSSSKKMTNEYGTCMNLHTMHACRRHWLSRCAARVEPTGKKKHAWHPMASDGLLGAGARLP